MKTKLRRISRRSLAIILCTVMLLTVIVVGDMTVVNATTIPSGKTFYLDVTNFSGSYNSGYYMSLSGNGSTTATSSDTSGVSTYKPKKDNSWVQMTKYIGNIYKGTTTAQNTNGRISFWSKNESSYDDVWRVNVSLGYAYDGTNDLFTISSDSTNHSGREADCFSGTWSKFSLDSAVGTATSRVVAGTDLMFYIGSYDSSEHPNADLVNSSKATPSSNYSTTWTKNGEACVSIAKSDLSTYNRITNNAGNWEGKNNQSSYISGLTAGGVTVWDKGDNGHNDRTTTTTTLSSSSIVTGTSSITLTSKESATNSSYGVALYRQYYLDGNLVSGSTKEASTSNQNYTLDTSSLSVGTHTLKTILTDRTCFYIGDTDTITVTKPSHTASVGTITGNGTVTVNGGSSATVTEDSSYTIVATPSQGYKLTALSVNNTSIIGTNANATTAVTVSRTMGTSNETVTATFTATLTQLSAPSTVTLNGSAANCTVYATTVGAKIRLAWSSVANAGSYKIYKGTDLVTTVTTLYYDIERANSYTGAYSVVAVPSNTSLYSESAKSTARTLTVNKQKLNAPTVTVTPTDIKSGDSVSLTATNTNTSYTSAQFNYYYYKSSLTVSNDYKLTAGTAKSITETSTEAPATVTYHVVAYPVNGSSNDYYTQSNATDSDSVSVYKTPDYKIAGDSNFIGSSKWSFDQAKEFSTYTSSGVYYFTTKSVSSGDHYFKLYTSSHGYSGNNDTNNDYAVTLGEENKYSLVQNDSKSFKVNGSGVFMIFFDVVNTKIWVTQNTWAITPHAYYSTFNLTSDSYDSAQAGTTGGTIQPDSETLVTKNTQTTLIATAAQGYYFDGWYNNSDFASGHRVSTNASYTFTPSSSGDYYALFKQNEPAHYTLSVSSVANATVTATYNGTTLQEGSGTKSVPVGATVSVSITLDKGCQLNSTNPSGLTKGTSTFTMPSSNTAVSANVTKIDYSLLAVKSPDYGTLKFYSDSNCTSEITTRQYNQTFYAKYTPADGYSLNQFTISGTGASINTVTGNVAKCTMGTAAVTVTANVALEHTVTYYVDMHSDSVVESIGLYRNGGLTEVLQYNDNGTQTDCIKSATQQGTSTVYAADIRTPLTSSGSDFNSIYVKVTYRMAGASPSDYKIVTLNSSNLTTINTSSDKSVWMEAVSDSPQDLSIVYSTNQTPTVESGYQRIYLKKPYGWQNTTEGQKWTNIGVYYWGDNLTDIGWANDNSGDYRVTKMNYLGYDTSSGHHYYYADIPTKIADGGTDYTVKNLIFQGWGTNTSLGGDSNKILAKTENIMNFTKNYFTLENNNNVITGVPAESNALVPGYTRYASSVTAQKGEEDTISVKPTSSNTNFAFSSKNTSVATVNASTGVVTPVAKGTTTITVKVYGTVGYLVRSHEQTDKDYREYTVSVTIKDPTVTSGFNIMSLATRTSTITIPAVSSTQPGYFDSAPSVAVTGTPNAPTAGYTNSAIVSPSDNAVTGPGISGTKYKTYTVKYAAPSTFSGYTGITVTAKEITSMSIPYNDSARYGYKQWNVNSTTDDSVNSTKDDSISGKVTKSVSNGVETAVTKNFELTGAFYYEIFEPYSYVDVTFNFDYYEYKTERTVQKLDEEGNPIPLKDGSGNIIDGQYETEQKNFYYYDPEWIGNDDSRAKADAENNSQAGLVHYVQKTYTVTDFEVRLSSGQNSSNVTAANIYDDAFAAIGNKPYNNYYDYTISDSTIKDITTNGNYKATVKVEMTHTPKTYRVFRNGTRQTGGSGAKGNYYYQEYANLTNGTSLNWILTDSGNSYTGPTLYTGRNYKFRVTGDTYLKTAAGSIADDEFNRSKVNLANQEITHEPKSTSNPTVVEKLINNFYIADFFDPDKVLNDRGLKEDDVKFVGGGVLYYQVKDGVPAQKAVDGGYVDSNGLADEDAMKEFIQEKIEAGLENTSIVPNDIEGTDDRMAIAYGYNYDAQKDGDTDIFYRYLPYEVYKRTNGGDLEKAVKKDDQGNIVYEQDGETPVMEYTFATDRQSNAYRYSNALKAYQYIYASKQENKITNEGKDMRLYAYYIYSYTKYDQDTGIPETVYKVVLSDQPANASTYFDSTP